ncbi:MAG: hypothetical protein M1268_04410 [Patescibacteria group bacterium]|nr:hypothetical protein [Patescibacteria group bacterium]
MDDKTQTDTQQTVNQSSQPPSQVSPQKVVITPQIQPTAPVHKEFERPVGVSSELNDYVKSSETPPQVEQEVLDAGVQKVDHLPKLSDQHNNIGVKHSIPPVSRTIAEPSVVLPMTKQEAEKTLRHNPVSSAIKWKAAEVLKQFSKLFIGG